MQVKITVKVSEDDEAIAQGEISGELDLTKGNPDGQPILTVKMHNILNQVRETIYLDSRS